MSLYSSFKAVTAVYLIEGLLDLTLLLGVYRPVKSRECLKLSWLNGPADVRSKRRLGIYRRTVSHPRWS